MARRPVSAASPPSLRLELMKVSECINGISDPAREYQHSSDPGMILTLQPLGAKLQFIKKTCLTVTVSSRELLAMPIGEIAHHSPKSDFPDKNGHDILSYVTADQRFGFTWKQMGMKKACRYQLKLKNIADCERLAKCFRNSHTILQELARPQSNQSTSQKPSSGRGAASQHRSLAQAPTVSHNQATNGSEKDTFGQRRPLLTSSDTAGPSYATTGAIEERLYAQQQSRGFDELRHATFDQPTQQGKTTRPDMISENGQLSPGIHSPSRIGELTEQSPKRPKTMPLELASSVTFARPLLLRQDSRITWAADQPFTDNRPLTADRPTTADRLFTAGRPATAERPITAERPFTADVDSIVPPRQLPFETRKSPTKTKGMEALPDSSDSSSPVRYLADRPQSSINASFGSDRRLNGQIVIAPQTVWNTDPKSVSRPSSALMPTPSPFSRQHTEAYHEPHRVHRAVLHKEAEDNVRASSAAGLHMSSTNAEVHRSPVAYQHPIGATLWPPTAPAPLEAPHNLHGSTFANGANVAGHTMNALDRRPVTAAGPSNDRTGMQISALAGRVLEPLFQESTKKFTHLPSPAPRLGSIANVSPSTNTGLGVQPQAQDPLNHTRHLPIVAARPSRGLASVPSSDVNILSSHFVGAVETLADPTLASMRAFNQLSQDIRREKLASVWETMLFDEGFIQFAEDVEAAMPECMRR